jgi:cytochrome c peroxidase
MGLPLDVLRIRLAETPFYPSLFEAAFGDAEVTNERIAKALAQFVRSMVSYNSKYDRAFEVGMLGFPDFAAVFNESEQLGQLLFERTPQSVKCHECHRSTAFIGNEPRNIGLDSKVIDPGAGNGRFKVPSLRNIAVRGRFMHDGRFKTLREVVEFYDHGVQDNPFLDPLLRIDGDPANPVEVLNLTEREKQALIDFMQTFTDEQFLNDPKFSDPFGPQPLFGDVNLDGRVSIADVLAFIARLLNGPYQNEADVNQDGVVNLRDVNPFVQVLNGA